MPRLMSVSHTADAVVERRKTVTRRLGWRFLKPGDRLTLCRKVMGRKPGEPLERLAEVEVVSVRREPIMQMTDADVPLEGVAMFDEHGHRRFLEWYDDGQPTASAWVTWWLWQFAPRGFNPYMDDVTRIEWRYL
jgi:hypothetical protein